MSNPFVPEGYHHEPDRSVRQHRLYTNRLGIVTSDASTYLDGVWSRCPFSYKGETPYAVLTRGEDETYEEFVQRVQAECRRLNGNQMLTPKEKARAIVTVGREFAHDGAKYRVLRVSPTGDVILDGWPSASREETVDILDLIAPDSPYKPVE